MAACLKLANFDFGSFRPKLSALQTLLGFGTVNSVRFEGFLLSRGSKKASTRRRRWNSDGNSPSTADTVDCSEEIESYDAVEYLLIELCDTTSIAQFELKKDLARERQALCYIEQLGAQTPVKWSVTGEVVQIVLNDGDPVGYDDSMISLLPSFPGIKKLQ